MSWWFWNFFLCTNCFPPNWWRNFQFVIPYLKPNNRITLGKATMLLSNQSCRCKMTRSATRSTNLTKFRKTCKKRGALQQLTAYYTMLHVFNKTEGSSIKQLFTWLVCRVKCFLIVLCQRKGQKKKKIILLARMWWRYLRAITLQMPCWSFLAWYLLQFVVGKPKQEENNE